MRQRKATAWLSSIVTGLCLAAGLLTVTPAAQATDTGTPRTQIWVKAPLANFRPTAACRTESYSLSSYTPAPTLPGGGIDYTPFAWYATVTVTDAAGTTVGTPNDFGSGLGDSGWGGYEFPVCPDAAAGTWTITLSYRECEGADLTCASTDPVATYTTVTTFLVTDPPPADTSVEVASVSYTARKAVVTSSVTAAATLPSSTRLVVQKKAKGKAWKSVRTVTAGTAGKVSTKIKRTHGAQRVRFYLPAMDGFKAALSPAVKVKARTR